MRAATCRVQAAFQTTHLGQDPRLRPWARVVGVEVGTEPRVYPLQDRGQPVVNARVGVARS